MVPYSEPVFSFLRSLITELETSLILSLLCMEIYLFWLSTICLNPLRLSRKVCRSSVLRRFIFPPILDTEFLISSRPSFKLGSMGKYTPFPFSSVKTSPFCSASWILLVSVASAPSNSFAVISIFGFFS